MTNVPRNPYLRKKFENGEIILTEPEILAADIHDGLQDHIKNTRKRPFSSPHAGGQLEALLSPHEYHSLQVKAMHSDIQHNREDNINISQLNPYSRTNKSTTTTLESVQILKNSPSIDMESKSLNDFSCKNSASSLHQEVGGEIVTSDGVISPTTIENNAQDNFDEYDSNIDWNAILLQVDLDQISNKMTGINKYDNNIKTTSVSTDQNARGGTISHDQHARGDSISNEQYVVSTDQYVYGASISNNQCAPGASGPYLYDQLAQQIKTCTTATEEQDITNDTCIIKSSISHSHLTSNYLPASSELKLLNYDKSRVAVVDDEYKQELIKNADLHGVLSNGWKLLSHQKAGVLRALMMRRMVLAFDMGTGKTLVGCVWAKAFKLTFPDIQVFIICPVSLAEDWGRTAWEATRLESEFDDKKISAKASKAKAASESVRGSPTCKIFSWAKVPSVPKNIEKYIIICDEAHQMQNTESSRTKETLNLALSERCIGVLLLTGTPMKNGRPSNIFPLLKAVKHPFGDDQYSFEVTFCNGRFRHFKNTRVWDASGASNLTALNSHIATHVLCKNKDDCLQDLPPKTREYKTVQVSSRFELQYAHAMNELVKIQDLVDQSSDDEVKSEAVLGAFQIVRLLASKAKIDATVSMARSILEIESSIVIFTYFVDVAKELHKKLRDNGWNSEVLVGEVPPTKRQDMVDKFQAGITPVFIATFGAGGVGLTLTAACTIILLDRPWTPGDAFQAEDRVRRIGQTRPVRSIWMRGFDVDFFIDNMIEQKNENSTAVVVGRSTRAETTSIPDAPRVSLRSLIQNLIKNSSTVKEKIHNSS